MEELIVLNTPKSSTTEAIKTLRTNLQCSLIDGDAKTILVTSSVPSEGKSFISSNLSVAFSQLNMKVLIIDADLRCGRQDEIFDLFEEQGLTKLLLSKLYKLSDYVKETPVKNVFLLPSGLSATNPSELLSTKKFAKILELLKEEFDLIIIDGAPLNAVTDSLILAELVDKILLVTAIDYTPRDLLVNSRKSLEKYQSKILGTVINNAPVKKSKYYGSYYK